MKRSLAIVLAGLVAIGAVFAVSYVFSRQFCAHQIASTDELDWLRQEFNLKPAELERVRALHEGYLPKCAEMCRQIAAKKQELERALTGQTNVSTAAEQALADLGALRARCQAEMLRHFVAVSQAMPPEQGQRYLAEMQRLTLGFHEQIEQSMSPSGHAHGSH